MRQGMENGLKEMLTCTKSNSSSMRKGMENGLKNAPACVPKENRFERKNLTFVVYFHFKRNSREKLLKCK